MMELAEQQRQEIASSGWPPELVDSQTGEKYVLIHREMFERVRTILEEEENLKDVEEMLRLGSEVWEQDEPNSQESA